MEWWQRALKTRNSHVYQYTRNTSEFGYIALPLFNDEGDDAVGVVRLRINLNQLFNKTLGSFKHGKSSTVFISDRHQIYPPITSFSPFSIGELISFTQNIPGQFFDSSGKYLLGTESLGSKISGVVPRFNWSLVYYQLKPIVFTPKHPMFRKILMLWFFGVIFLFMLSYIVTNWITDPLQSLIMTIREIANGNFNVRVPVVGKGEFAEISEAVNQLAKTMEGSTSDVTKSLRESHASISAFEDFTQEAALEQNRHLIADSLLRLSIRKLNADAGILIIKNPDYKSPMILKYNLDDEQINRYTSLKLHGVKSKKIFFPWDHPEHQEVWNDEFQVLLATPVRTRHSQLGTLYILFYQVISTDIEKDRTIELMAQQAAVYSSRSDLLNKIKRHNSFTEGILSGIPWFIITIDSQMNITWSNQQQVQFLRGFHDRY